MKRPEIFAAVLSVLICITVPASGSEVKAPAGNGLDQEGKDAAMVKSGHRFVTMLVCPDGNSPKVAEVQSVMGSQGRFLDTYNLICDDGTTGSFVWAEDQTAPPATPKSFRLKTKEEMSRFAIVGRVNEISPTPSGGIWITTMTGHSYFAADLAHEWREGSLRATAQYGSSIERITFFDEKTAVATGYLAGKYYRTENAGRTWQELDQTNRDWIYDVFSTADNKVWMGGSSGKILFSNDKGKTWRTLKSPFDEGSRLHRIFMASGSSGIAGSLDKDMLFVTSNNWTTFERLQTPHSQGLTENIQNTVLSLSDNQSENEAARRASLRKASLINRVAILGKTYLVVQGNAAFWMPELGEKWTRLTSPPITGLIVDPTEKRLFAVDKRGCLYKASENMILTPAAEECLPTEIRDMKISNSELFLLGENEVLFKLSHGKLEKSKKLPR